MRSEAVLRPQRHGVVGRLRRAVPAVRAGPGTHRRPTAGAVQVRIRHGIAAGAAVHAGLLRVPLRGRRAVPGVRGGGRAGPGGHHPRGRGAGHRGRAIAVLLGLCAQDLAGEQPAVQSLRGGLPGHPAAAGHRRGAAAGAAAHHREQQRSHAGGGTAGPAGRHLPQGAPWPGRHPGGGRPLRALPVLHRGQDAVVGDLRGPVSAGGGGHRGPNRLARAVQHTGGLRGGHTAGRVQLPHTDRVGHQALQGAAAGPVLPHHGRLCGPGGDPAAVPHGTGPAGGAH
mmetsp:Transcript_12571/g.17262  ORF Transcript_12571/g.17262 Transcript_12571/m.17262 type:complete len:283 (-) Transcript_12571:786-1634(-)